MAIVADDGKALDLVISEDVGAPGGQKK